MADDKPVKTMVYIMAKEYTDMVSVPTEYYFNIIFNGYIANGVKRKHPLF